MVYWDKKWLESLKSYLLFSTIHPEVQSRIIIHDPLLKALLLDRTLNQCSNNILLKYL